jgi:hypothetical protein
MQRAPCPRTDVESQGGVSPRKPGRVPTGPSVPANARSLSSIPSVTLGCRPPRRSAADQVLLPTYLRRSHDLARHAWTTRTATVRRPARTGASAGRAVAKPAPRTGNPPRARSSREKPSGSALRPVKANRTCGTRAPRRETRPHNSYRSRRSALPQRRASVHYVADTTHDATPPLQASPVGDCPRRGAQFRSDTGAHAHGR